MYLTKKQVTPVPNYYFGREFVPPDAPGFYTWVLPDNTIGWSRDWRAAGSGGNSSYGGNAGSGNDSKLEWQDYWTANFGWSVKAITVKVAAGGAAGGGAGDRMWIYYTPYIPLPGVEPGTPRTTGDIAGASGLNGTQTVGGYQGTQMSSVDYGSVLELGGGGVAVGQAGDRANGGGRNGKGGNSWVKFRSYTEDNADVLVNVHYFTDLDSSFIGEDIVMIKWPTGYRYADVVFCNPGCGGQGGQAFSAGGCYYSSALVSTRIDRNIVTTWGYNPQLIFVHLGRPGKGGAIGKVWGGVGTSVLFFISPTSWNDAVQYGPFAIDRRDVPVSTSAVTSSTWLGLPPTSQYRTSSQTADTSQTITFQGRTYSNGAGMGQAPGRSGAGGNGGFTPTRGQDGAPGAVWWNIHN